MLYNPCSTMPARNRRKVILRLRPPGLCSDSVAAKPISCYYIEQFNIDYVYIYIYIYINQCFLRFSLKQNKICFLFVGYFGLYFLIFDGFRPWDLFHAIVQEKSYPEQSSNLNFMKTHVFGKIEKCKQFLSAQNFGRANYLQGQLLGNHGC